jgi:hypothetical protein
MILLSIQSMKRTIPLSIKQANTIPIEHIQHMSIVSRCRRRRRWRTYLRTTKELHPSIVTDKNKQTITLSTEIMDSAKLKGVMVKSMSRIAKMNTWMSFSLLMDAGDELRWRFPGEMSWDQCQSSFFVVYDTKEFNFTEKIVT